MRIFLSLHCETFTLKIGGALQSPPSPVSKQTEFLQIYCKLQGGRKGGGGVPSHPPERFKGEGDAPSEISNAKLN